MPTRASDRVTLAVVASPTYVRTYYRMQASTAAAPAVPTTNPPAAPWTTTEPAYTAGSTDTLYTVQLIAYGSAAFEYGPVQKSAAFEAAKQAYNLANQANEGQAEIPRPLHGTAVPTNTAPVAPINSVYYRHQGSVEGPMMASYTRVVGGWVETPLLIRAGQVQAGAIDGLTVTGSTLRTAASGQRMQFDVNGLRAFDAGGSITASLYSGNGGLAVSGSIGVNSPAPYDVSTSAYLTERNAMVSRSYPAQPETSEKAGLSRSYVEAYGLVVESLERNTAQGDLANFRMVLDGPRTSGERLARISASAPIDIFAGGRGVNVNDAFRQKGYGQPTFAAGAVNVPALGPEGSWGVTITFPAGQFSGGPSMFLQSYEARYNIGIVSVSASSVSIVVLNVSAAGGGASSLRWLAAG